MIGNAKAEAIANDWQCEEIKCVAMNVPWQTIGADSLRLQVP